MRKHARQQRRPLQNKHDSNNHNMGPISIQLIVSNERNAYKAGDFIDGRIVLSVAEEADCCKEFNGIHLSFEGKESIEFQPLVHRSSSLPDRYTKTILTLDEEVTRFRSPLCSGTYEYPFSWQLPEEQSSLPSSMLCVSDRPKRSNSEELGVRTTCEVHYNLMAYLSSTSSSSTSESEWNVDSCKQPIQIAGGRLNDGDNNSIIEPKSFPVKSWLKKRGYIELGIETHAVEASPGSDFMVGITGRNLSTVPVKEIKVQWIETVQWGTVHSPKGETRRIVAESTVSRKEMPCTWQPNNTTTRNSQKKSKVAISPNAEPQKPDKSIMAHLRLKKDTRDSYKGRMIQVHHFLQVTAITQWNLSTNPEITTPTTVRRRHGSDAGRTMKDNNNNIGTHLRDIPETMAININIPADEGVFRPRNFMTESLHSSSESFR